MGSGILGLIGNYVNARHERQNEKDREALKRYYEAELAIRHPDIGKYMANATEDAHAALADLVGDKEYKEHQPFVHKALMGLGNAVIGSFSGTLPMWGQRVPQIPTAMDPQTGKPINVIGQGEGAQPSQAQPGAADTSQVFPGFAEGVQGIPDATRERIAGQLATLAGQGQQAQPPPTAGIATPASTLAPSTTEGATPTGLIGARGPGGFYELPRDIKDPGREAFLKHEGVFGKTPQQVQQIIDVYHQEVRAGRMSAQDAATAIQKAIQAEMDPTTKAATAEGTYTERWFRTPDTTDEKGNKVPGKPIAMMENSRDPNKLYRPDTGEFMTGKDIAQAGWQRIRTPSAAADKTVDADPNEPGVQEYIAANFPNFDLKKLPPGQGLVMKQDAQGNWSGPPHWKPMNPNQRESLRMSDVRSFQAGVQRQDPKTGQWRDLTPREAEELGDAKYRKYRSLQMSRIDQGERNLAYKTGIGIEDQPLPAGYRVREGYAEDPQEITQDNPDPLGAGDAAKPTPADTAKPTPANTDAVRRMQTGQAPAAQPPPSQTPNVIPGQLPSGPQPATAGVPGVAPSASTTPQAPAVHTPSVQPVQPPAQPTAAPPAAAQVTPPQGGVAPPSTYISSYLAWTKDKPMSSQAAMGRTMMAELVKQHYAKQGQQLTNEQVGLLLSSAENDWQAYGAAQARNTERQALVIPLVDTLDKLADQMIATSRSLPDHGSRMANSFYRDILSQFQNNPAMASARTQGLGMASTWGQVISNAISSNAQLEAGALKATHEILTNNATWDEAQAAASRIKLEGNVEKWRYENAKYKIEKQKAQSLFGKVIDYEKLIGPPPKEPPNVPPPPDGYTIKVKGEDRYIHYDAVKGGYVPGPGRIKPFNMGRFK